MMLNMKNIKHILFLAAAMLTLNACFDDYLTVNPKTDITTEVFFASEAGFKDALAGVYVQMKSPAIYGSNLSMTTIEHLVSNYNMVANTTPLFLSRWMYEQQSVESTFSSIFSNLFKVVAAANAILDKIDENQDVFKTEGLYEMIKGEALAIRAYCQLDVLRLFGPVPAALEEEIMLPYASSLSREPVPHISFAQYRQRLLSDLSQAEVLLRGVDPLLDYSVNDTGTLTTGDFRPADSFLAFRTIRMNYYAVKALQARAYLWFGDKAEAFEAAKTVIDAVNPDDSPKFRLGSAADMTGGNLILTTEHLFALHDFNLADRYSSLFASGDLYRGTNATIVNNQLYGNTGTDIREINLHELVVLPNGANRYILKKYKNSGTANNFAADYRRIPLLRLGEMYLIAVEAAPAATAQSLWEAFCVARNINPGIFPEDVEQLKSRLVIEYRREFYGEGQSFYAYKRVNAERPAIIWSSTLGALNYVVPLPVNEIIQNN
jgi:starch-binding outer membrane protein, SusD/RagB family